MIKSVSSAISRSSNGSAPAGATHQEPARPAQPRGRLLIIDDDADLTGLLAKYAQERGYQVFEHHACKGAVEKARAVHPQYVILDVMLGDGIGYQVARRLRAEPNLFAVPILFMSAASEQQDIEYARTQGGDLYLAKPFKFPEFTQKLDDLKRFREEMLRLCPETRLPGLAAMKRQINHRLFTGRSCALCCIEIIHLDEYHSRRGEIEWRHAVEVISRLLVDEVRRFGGPAAYLAHTFGGVFLALVALESYQHFLSHLAGVFSQRTRGLHTENELMVDAMIASGQAPEQEKSVLLTIHASAVHTVNRHFTHADRMLDALAETHSLTRPCRGSVIFVDRKHDHPFRLPGQ